MYRPRNPEASPFFALVRDHFDAFERVYDERFQPKYGYWRPIIRTAIDKYVKCGDLREGFARVRCPDCGKEYFVVFSCRQRCCCPSCDQKRSLLLGLRLAEEVFAPVSHRQWVLTMPKRLRIFFRYDRRLLGKLCRLAYETIRDTLRQACGAREGEPGFVGALQTFGDLMGWHSHVHAIVSEGLFKRDGFFIRISKVDMERCTEIWRDRVFDLLLREEKIDKEVVRSMRGWPHSGFSIDNSVRITADDTEGMQRLVSYISRCPFSLARMIKVSEEGQVIYRAGKSECVRFPRPGDERLREGVSRNFQVFDALEFLAEVTQHIPDKGQHLIHYFGWYSNKERGLRKKRAPVVTEAMRDGKDAGDIAFIKKRRMGWAALIRKVYEVDPLRCPECGGEMKIISFIEKCQPDVVEKILRHCGLWKACPELRREGVSRPPPAVGRVADGEPSYDYGYSDRICI
ncbi:MAG TPA: transposase [bacterium]|nr:transposase [bacterium]HQG44518.1 transposase [bacterium]